jgi:hypothetical protein
MRPSRIRILITLLLLLVLVVWAIPTAANFAIEYNWWKEVGQIPTWFGILWLSFAKLWRSNGMRSLGRSRTLAVR